MKNKGVSNEPLREGRDYYVENGCWVFTEHFLRQRGYCCGSGCRHCPYRKKHVSPDTPPNGHPDAQG